MYGEDILNFFQDLSLNNGYMLTPGLRFYNENDVVYQKLESGIVAVKLKKEA